MRVGDHGRRAACPTEPRVGRVGDPPLHGARVLPEGRSAGGTPTPLGLAVEVELDPPGRSGKILRQASRPPHRAALANRTALAYRAARPRWRGRLKSRRGRRLGVLHDMKQWSAIRLSTAVYRRDY